MTLHEDASRAAVFIAGGSQGLLKMKADESGVCTPCSLGTIPACFQVSTIDPLTYLGLAALVAGVALVAAYIPARRATRVLPMLALRGE